MTRPGKSQSELTAKQIAVIHVARRQLALKDDEYRSILDRVGGVTSSRDLDYLGFLKVMEHLKGLGFQSTWTKRTFGNRAGMASPAQVELMRGLWRDYAGERASDRDLDRWLRKYHKVEALRFVTAEIARKAIPALKQMAKRQ